MLVLRQRYFHALIAAGFAFTAFSAAPLQADQKPGMPDLGQEEQTCLPTSTSNLIVWFGLHGYPKLIKPGDSADDGFIHTVHGIMTETNARYDFGTRTDAITGGIAKYIRDAGYNCDVEYRGLDWTKVKRSDFIKDYDADRYKEFNTNPPSGFTQDWFNSNSDPNKGFILLLAYVKIDPTTNSFHYAINAGHAVTLVDAEPETLLIHDPAHYNSMPGRKIVTPQALTGGTLRLPGYDAPVDGLLLLGGSELESPPDSVILLTGAVCVTMHPAAPPGAMVGSLAGAPATMVGAAPVATPPAASPTPAPAAPASGNKGWGAWLYDFFFKN
jgi:hypothetical protein